jgi:hypothetical protein
MTLNRRTFLAATGLVATAPALATLLSFLPTASAGAKPRPCLTPSQPPTIAADTSCFVFEIDGWNCRDNLKGNESMAASMASAMNDLGGERVLISVNRSWRASWR